MINPPRILFVHNFLSTFVRYDLEILRKAYQVTEYFVPDRQLSRFREIPGLLAKHDLVFGWFASWHTFFPMLYARLLGRKSILVIGGYDLARLPQAGYGHQRGGMKRLVSRLTMQLASCLVTNSYFSQEEAWRNAGIVKEQVRVVYHGLMDPFGGFAENSKNGLVITVGNVENDNLLRKGHEPFVRAASHLPQTRFVLVGKWRDQSIDHLRNIATSNVVFTNWLSEMDLLNYYQRASVYVQASLHEGFGMSVAEAMLAGCIPVVTRRGALPEVVGDAGIYIEDNSPGAVSEGVRKALQADPEQRLRARQRILTEFPLEKRRQALTSIVKQLLDHRTTR